MKHKFRALRDATECNDFTVTHYRQLLSLALNNYRFVRYDDIPMEGRFILWRHDLDYSLNRALRLAMVEKEMGAVATFFLNLHSNFYNLYEKTQFQIVEQILSGGHHIGVHFDAAFYDITAEDELNALVADEANLLEKLFGVRPVAFSFHNPTEFLLSCEKDSYGGLLNCYSTRFKRDVSYCSDSNGYWRYRRLYDVLERAIDPCLQVLTHPGWWQEQAAYPRERIFRSVYGRAEATLAVYDNELALSSRSNIAGPSEVLDFLKGPAPLIYTLCSYLWNKRQFQTLFVELWRVHEQQIHQLCKCLFRNVWQVSAKDVTEFFADPNLRIDGWQLFMASFKINWQQASGVDEDTHREWVAIRNQLIFGRSSIPPEKLEEGCVYLCDIVNALAKWGQSMKLLRYDGIANLGNMESPTHQTASGEITEKLDENADEIGNAPKVSWEQFKVAQLAKHCD